MYHNFNMNNLPDIIRAYAGPWLMFGLFVAIITKVLPPNKTASKRIVGIAACLYVALQIAGQCKYILSGNELLSQACFFVPAAYLVVVLYDNTKTSSKS